MSKLDIVLALSREGREWMHALAPVLQWIGSIIIAIHVPQPKYMKKPEPPK